MSFNFKARLIAIPSNFWFVPSLLTLAAISSASIVLMLDATARSIALLPAGGLTAETARTAATDVDQLRVGQPAVVRFQNFHRINTPELQGKVVRISATTTTSQSITNAANSSSQFRPAAEVRTEPFFAVRITIPERELKKLGKAKLVPGKQVETFIATSDRTVMSYLLKPVVDRLSHVMRDR